MKKYNKANSMLRRFFSRFGGAGLDASGFKKTMEVSSDNGGGGGQSDITLGRAMLMAFDGFTSAGLPAPKLVGESINFDNYTNLDEPMHLDFCNSDAYEYYTVQEDKVYSIEDLPADYFETQRANGWNVAYFYYDLDELNAAEGISGNSIFMNRVFFQEGQPVQYIDLGYPWYALVSIGGKFYIYAYQGGD